MRFSLSKTVITLAFCNLLIFTIWNHFHKYIYIYIPEIISMLSGIPALWNHPLFWGGLTSLTSPQPRLWVMCHMSELLQVRSHLLKCMGRTYYSQPSGNISPFKGTFEDDDVPFPVWVGYVSSRQVLYTMLHPCVDVNASSPNFPCLWTSFRKWAMDRSCSRTGTSWHCTSISCWDKECLKPQPKTSPKRLAPEKHDDINRFKGFQNSNDFPRIEFFKHQVPRWKPTTKWFHRGTATRESPASGQNGVPLKGRHRWLRCCFLCNDFKDKTWKKRTFWHFEAY